MGVYDGLPVWPWRLLRGAAGESAQLVGRVLTGGSSLSGVQQAASTAGGGLWSLDLQGISLRTPDAIRCARAWAAYLDGGAALAIVPFFDLGQAPRPQAGGRAAIPGKPAWSDDYFSQEAGFGAPLIEAQIADAAPLRATSVRIVVEVGGRLRGGEHFSINHPDKGWRTYRTGRVQEASAGGYTCEIRPPLRQAVDPFTPAEFDVPRTVMRLDPSKAADFEAMVTGNRLASVSASFVEAFGAEAPATAPDQPDPGDTGGSTDPGGSTPITVPPLQNYVAANYTAFHQALARARAGTGGARIVIYGDSTTEGFGSGTGTPPITGARLTRPSTRMAVHLSTLGYPASSASQFGDDGAALNAGLLADYDARWGVPADWSVLHSFGYFGAGLIKNDNGAGVLTFTETGVDSFEVFYAINNSIPFGTLNVLIDGAPPASGVVAINTSAAPGLGRVTVKAAAVGAHTLGITRSGTGAVYIVGVRAFNSSKPQVEVISGGNCAVTAEGLDDEVLPFDGLGVLKALAPNLTIINAALNDEAQATDLPTYTAALTDIVNAAKLSGDALLVFPWQRLDAVLAYPTFKAAVLQVANATGVALLDLGQSFDASQLVDAVHMTAKGYDDVAQIYAQTVLTL